MELNVIRNADPAVAAAIEAEARKDAERILNEAKQKAAQIL